MKVFRSSAAARLSFALALAVSVGAVSLDRAFAQQQTATQRFLANPGQILQQYPDGNPQMISILREVAIADPNSLPVILGLIPNANKDQKTAIGKALGQAATVVVKTNQPYANSILQAIAETKDQDVFLAYSGSASDTGTAATGGGGAGAGGGIGGQSNTIGGVSTSGGGTAESIGGGSTPTANFSYTSSVSGGGTTTTTGTTGTGGGTTTNIFNITNTTSP